MSECSAVVRLQVVHPVSAFLFESFFEKSGCQNPYLECYRYRHNFNRMELSSAPPHKKTGGSEVISAILS